MNTGKIVRDVIIVILLAVVVYAGIQLFGSKNPGPVEQVAGGTMENPHAQDPEASPPHMPEPPELTAGAPVVTWGDFSVGRDWYDDRVAIETDTMDSQGVDPATASPTPAQIALISGLIEIIFNSSAQEYGIEPDPEEIAAKEATFYGSFETEEEANSMLEEMGISLERLRGMWADDLVAKDTEMNGLEPDTPEGDDAFQTWLEDKVMNTPWVFSDPEMQSIYDSYIEALVAFRAGTPESEESAGEL
jgi:hypothetical protein